MQILNIINDGKGKRVYSTDDNDYAVIYFKDQALAFNGLKRGRIIGKGEVNCSITECLYTLLEQNNIKTHFVKVLDANQILVKNVEIIPTVIKIRNRVAGSLANRFAWATGKELKNTILELCYKDESLNNPMINETHILAMGLASLEEVEFIKTQALKINNILREFLKPEKIDLVDFKLEFGRYKGEIILADEISPDNSRFWDSETDEPMDMDRFRWAMGDVEENYRELLRRLMDAKK